jgi:hypothetical protein
MPFWPTFITREWGHQGMSASVDAVTLPGLFSTLEPTGNAEMERARGMCQLCGTMDQTCDAEIERARGICASSVEACTSHSRRNKAKVPKNPGNKSPRRPATFRRLGSRDKWCPYTDMPNPLGAWQPYKVLAGSRRRCRTFGPSTNSWCGDIRLHRGKHCSQSPGQIELSCIRVFPTLICINTKLLSQKLPLFSSGR